MILDLHTHCFPEPGVVPGWFWDGMKQTIAASSGQTIEQVEQTVFADFWDPNGDGLVREMDEAGVDQAVVLCLDWGLAGLRGEADYPAAKLNEMYHDIVVKHPGRLMLGCGMDPRRPDAIEIVRRGVREHGAKLVKAYPPAGWYANDKAIYPFYQAIIELDVPVLIHTGPSLGHLLSKYSAPQVMEELAADLPELRIICAHTGFGLWRDYAAIAQFKRNLYLETGAWSREASAHPQSFYATVREMMDRAPGRVFFASDHWGFRGTLAPFVQAAVDMKARAAAYGIEFTDEEIASFPSGVAAGLIGLTHQPSS